MTERLKEILETHEATEPFLYSLLDRMRQDCKYYLGAGSHETNKTEKLWSGSVKGIIEDMTALYNNFPEDERPEWLTLEDIEAYKREMEATT